MSTEAISVGPATAILEDVVYALPAKLCFITSTLEVETSVDGLIWTALTGSDTTGAIAPGVFVRCSSDATVVLRDAVGIYSSSGSGSNPFDQDLNTTNLVQFLGLGITVPAVDSQITMTSSVTLAWDNVTIGSDGQFVIITDAGLKLPADQQITFEAGAAISADGFSLILNGGPTIDGDGNLSNVETVSASAYLVGATPGIDTTITTGSLVGKTITITKGIITGFA